MKPKDYFRRDRKEGITAPDLTKSYSVAERIVRARGKRTNFTSVSLDLVRLHDFGEAQYQLKRAKAEADRHRIIEHEELMTMLLNTCRSSDKYDRARALQAMRYAKTRLEGLIEWRFDASAIERKGLIKWAYRQIQKYFRKI
jgi:hypothetical protein